MARRGLGLRWKWRVTKHQIDLPTDLRPNPLPTISAQACFAGLLRRLLLGLGQIILLLIILIIILTIILVVIS